MDSKDPEVFNHFMKDLVKRLYSLHQEDDNDAKEGESPSAIGTTRPSRFGEMGEVQPKIEDADTHRQ